MKDDKTFPGTPAYNGMQHPAASGDTAQPSHVQQPAVSEQADAGSNPVPDIGTHIGIEEMEKEATSPSTEIVINEDDFKLAVDDVRLRLHQAGISKSKDSIQRYCREGQLDCAKLGIFKRYFATEDSVEKLIESFSKDADGSSGTQLHEVARSDGHRGTQVHPTAASPENPKTNKLHEVARSSMPDDVQLHEPEDMPRAKEGNLMKELRNQISDLKDTNKFLQEELKDRRQQTKALTTVIDAFKENAEASKIQALVEQSRQEQQDGNFDYQAEVVTKDAEPNMKGDNSQPDTEGFGV